jgi:hypothetical protein
MTTRKPQPHLCAADKCTRITFGRFCDRHRPRTDGGRRRSEWDEYRDTTSEIERAQLGRDDDAGREGGSES